MRWYQQTWVMWLFLIGFWPIGAVLLLIRRRQYTKRKFYAILALTGLWFLYFLWNSHQADVQKKQYEQAIAESQMATKKAQPQKERIVRYIKQGLPNADNINVTLDNVPDEFSIYFELKSSSANIEEAKQIGKESIEKLLNGGLDAKVIQYHVVVITPSGSAWVVYDTPLYGNGSFKAKTKDSAFEELR